MDDKTKQELEQIMKDRSKDFKVQEVVILVLITCVFSFFAGFSFSRMKDNPKVLQKQSDDNSTALQEFIKEYQSIVQSYYGEVDEEKLLSAALKGVLEEIGDDYSVYMDDDDYSNLNLNLEGSYSGIGISIYKDISTNNMIIASVFENSAADKAGLKENDIILSVDGESVKELTTSDFSQKVLKSSKKQFVLRISRNGKELDIKV